MSCRRCLRSLARQRRSSFIKVGGVFGGRADQSGSRCRIAPSESAKLSPENGCRPVSISYSTQPNEKMSLRLSTGLPRACSGLMYPAVPKMTPDIVGLCPRGPQAGRRIGLLSIRCNGRGLFHRAGQAEVEYLDRAIGTNNDVGRLEVAVNNSVFMGGFECLGNLAR